MLTNLLIVLVLSTALSFGLQTPTAAQSSIADAKTGVHKLAAEVAADESADKKDSNEGAQSKESVKSSGSSISQEQLPEASSDKTPPVPGSSQEGSIRVVQARLKGSLCPSCMMTLQKKLRELDGVRDARIIRPAKNGGAIVNEPRFAQVEIIYLAEKQNLKKLKKYVERNDFGLRNEKDMVYTADYKPIQEPAQ